MLIVYYLDAQSGNPTSNLNLRIVYLEQLLQEKIMKKNNYMYRAFGITFDSAGSWSFDYDTA